MGRFVLIFALFACAARAQWTNGYSWGANCYTIPAQSSLSGNLTNFTVPIHVTDLKLRSVSNGGVVTNASGYDIAWYTTAGGTTLMSWDLKTWNSGSGEAIFFLKFPTISTSVSESACLFAGNSSVTTFQGGALGASYDSNTAAIYHFANGTTLSGADASANGNNATSLGAVTPTALAGLNLDGAAQLSGDGFAPISLPNNASLNITGAITLSAWYYGDTEGSIIVGGANSAYTAGYTWGINRLQPNGSGHWQPCYWDSSAVNWKCDTTAINSSTPTLYYLAVTNDGTNVKFYQNGVLTTTIASTGFGASFERKH